jgi:hypothetical protein
MYWKLDADLQAFTLVTLSFLTILTNSALFNLRARHATIPPQQAYPPHPQHQQQYLPGQHYPQYPGQAPQQGMGMGMQGWQQPGLGGGPAPNAVGWHGEEDKGKKKGWW